MTRIIPTFTDISPATQTTPFTDNWYKVDTVNRVGSGAVPVMLAQGFEITNARRGASTQTTTSGTREVSDIFSGVVTSTTVQTTEYTYDLRRTTLQNEVIVQELLNSFTNAYNEGRDITDKRYEDILRVWGDMLDKTQTDMDTHLTTLDGRVNLYLAELTDLETDYEDFFTDVKAELDDLTVSLDADRTRVNNAFDAQLAASDQGLANHGFYSSAMISNIDAGIEERRQLALTEITEREQRLTADVTLRKNEIYLSVLRMRAGLIDSRMGLTNRQQDFLAYQIDTRNRLILGLLGVVENREDVYPGLGSMAQIASSIGQQGGQAWRSG